jgi:hypothetical protein
MWNQFKTTWIDTVLQVYDIELLIVGTLVLIYGIYFLLSSNKK